MRGERPRVVWNETRNILLHASGGVRGRCVSLRARVDVPIPHGTCARLRPGAPHSPRDPHLLRPRSSRRSRTRLRTPRDRSGRAPATLPSVGRAHLGALAGGTRGRFDRDHSNRDRRPNPFRLGERRRSSPRRSTGGETSRRESTGRLPALITNGTADVIERPRARYGIKFPTAGIGSRIRLVTVATVTMPNATTRNTTRDRNRLSAARLRSFALLNPISSSRTRAARPASRVGSTA
jgi:hypothetical protein